MCLAPQLVNFLFLPSDVNRAARYRARPTRHSKAKVLVARPRRKAKNFSLKAKAFKT